MKRWYFKYDEQGDLRINGMSANPERLVPGIKHDGWFDSHDTSDFYFDHPGFPGLDDEEGDQTPVFPPILGRDFRWKDLVEIAH